MDRQSDPSYVETVPVVPRQSTSSIAEEGPGEEPKAPTTPEAVCRAAGLEMSAFTGTVPTEAPPNASDQVRAWSRRHPKIPNTGLTIWYAPSGLAPLLLLLALPLVAFRRSLGSRGLLCLEAAEAG